MNGFTKLETLIVIFCLSLIAASAIFALNPQEFLAKRKDQKILEQIAKTRSTTPIKLHAKANIALCSEGLPWAMFSEVDERTGIVCSVDTPTQSHQNFIR